MEAAVTPKAGGKRAATGARTIAEAFRLTSAERNDDVAIRTRGDEFTITWGALRDRVDALAGGLAQLGLGRGDTLALMIGNRPEFHICDLAGMMVGAAPFSIYSTYTAEQITYLLKDAEARIVICEEQYLERILEARQELPELEHVIVIDGKAPPGVMLLSEVEGADPSFDVEASRTLSQHQRERLLALAGPRIVAVAQDDRSQARNRELALHRLAERIAGALSVPRARRATRPTAASRQRRLDAKRRASRRKLERRRPSDGAPD